GPGSSRPAPGRRVQTSTLVSETPSFRATSRRRSNRTALVSSRIVCIAIHRVLVGPLGWSPVDTFERVAKRLHRTRSDPDFQRAWAALQAEGWRRDDLTTPGERAECVAELRQRLTAQT